MPVCCGACWFLRADFRSPQRDGRGVFSTSNPGSAPLRVSDGRNSLLPRARLIVKCPTRNPFSRFFSISDTSLLPRREDRGQATGVSSPGSQFGRELDNPPLRKLPAKGMTKGFLPHVVGQLVVRVLGGGWWHLGDRPGSFFSDGGGEISPFGSRPVRDRDPGGSIGWMDAGRSSA